MRIQNMVRTMKPGGGAPKGGEFERLICRRLTYWHCGKERPEWFWRSASSGAKATQNRKAGQDANQDGDIIAVDDRGRWLTDAFCIECKDRKDFRVELCMEGRGVLWDWWTKTCSDANRADKMPMLIFKRLRSPIYIAYPTDEFPNPSPSGFPVIFTDNYNRWVMATQFEDWMKEFNVKTVKGWLK